MQYKVLNFCKKYAAFAGKITIIADPVLRFARLLRLTNTMKEFEFIGYVVPLRNRMFRYAQSLLLCADEAEEALRLAETQNADLQGLLSDCEECRARAEAVASGFCNTPVR